MPGATARLAGLILIMIYLTPDHSNIDRYSRHYGQIFTPSSWGRQVYLRYWAADNEAFTKTVMPETFFSFLDRMLPHQQSCLFVTVPDVVGNAVATLESFRWWAWRIKARGWPIAFVAQDGQENLPFPPEFDVLFIGGSTKWKMSGMADGCIRRAKAAGKWVHVGRVNSQRRIRHFQLMGVDSVDGTTFTYAPDREIQRISKQLMQRPLFTMEA
jgi:hypothetical protein